MLVANRFPLTLRTYRVLTAMAVPAADVVLNYRLKRGKELAARLPERRGESSVTRPEGPLVWLHGASVGEMLSVLPLIKVICTPCPSAALSVGLALPSIVPPTPI